MKKYSRLWNMIAAPLIIGLCIIIAACVLSIFIANNDFLRKEEISMFGNILMELTEMKKTLHEIGARLPQGMPEEAPRPPKPGEKKVEGVTPGTNPIKGNAHAPVLVVQFGDFQCPFSKRFYQETFPQLEKEYIATGKIGFASRDFPLPFHPFAEPAAVASRCAARQNKYWEMYDRLNANEQIDAQHITGFATDLKLSMKDFNDCLKDPAVKEAVRKDAAEGMKFGVGGTPAFFVNGRMLEGAYPFEAFKAVIDEESAKK